MGYRHYFVRGRAGFDSCYGRQGATRPNLLDGASATVGGPDENDEFADERNNYEQTEATTYNNAPLMGVLARLAAGHGGGRFGHHSLAADGNYLSTIQHYSEFLMSFVSALRPRSLQTKTKMSCSARSLFLCLQKLLPP